MLSSCAVYKGKVVVRSVCEGAKAGISQSVAPKTFTWPKVEFLFA